MDSEPLHPAIRGLKAVCRCNNIKFRTIERVIREGAVTVSQVATRTTATTGHCGGGCTPDILAMIEEFHGAKKTPAPTPVPVVAPVEAATPADQPWWIKK